MSALTPETGYQAGPGTILNRAIWNAVMASIHARLNEVEATEASFDALIAEGTSLSIQAIQENLGPQLVAVADQIAALQQTIIAAEDAVAEIIAGNLPAGNVTFAPAGGVGAVNVQAAIVEVASDLEQASATLTEAVNAKPSLGLAFALGG